MYDKLRRNAVWAVFEVLGSSLALFFLYRIVVRHLGIEALGVWSLVVATTSLGRFADLGTAAGLGRFVATAQARQDTGRTIDYVETAVVTNFLLYLGIALLLWGPAWYGLSLVMEPHALASGRQLLPYSLLSFVLVSVSSATTGAIVGQHRSDQKSMISLAGTLTQLFVSLLFVARYGLPALAWAQIVQNMVVIAASWLLFLRNHFGAWAFRLPVHWRKDVFRELIGFGMKLQAVSIAGMLYDPAIKFLMSSEGGLKFLGYFEMAQRLILQVRQLVLMPNQVLVPGFAHLMESEPEKVGPLYHRAMVFSCLFGLPMLGGVTLLSPLISYVWIGHVEPRFVLLVVILSAGWFVNLMGAPATLLGMGIGRVRWNVLSACLTTAGSCVLGYALGHFFGGFGVAFAAGCMLILGASLNTIMNCRMMGIAILPGILDFRDALRQLCDFIRPGRRKAGAVKAFQEHSQPH